MGLDVCIKKRFENFSIDLSFCQQDVNMGVLGRSGMGKSVTLKMIAGLIRPDEGHIVLNGKVLFDHKKGICLPARERKIGYLFQDYALFPHMTVIDNIQIAMKKKNVFVTKRLLEQFQIEDIAGRRPAELSGGQKQRVAFARILASEPELLLLDEPFSALDQMLKQQLMDDLMIQVKAFNGDMIMVSHAFDEIFHCCQQMIAIDHGKICANGPVKEILIKPPTVVSAQLVGYKNIIPGQAIGYDEDVMLAIQNAAIDFHHTDCVYRQLTIEVVLEQIVEWPHEWEYVLRIKDTPEYLYYRVSEQDIVQDIQEGEKLKIYINLDKVSYLRDSIGGNWM